MNNNDGVNSNKFVTDTTSVVKNILIFASHEGLIADRQRTLKNRMRFIAYKNNDNYIFAPVDFAVLKKNPNLKKVISIPDQDINILLGDHYEKGILGYNEIYTAYEAFCAHYKTSPNVRNITRLFWLIDSDGARSQPSAHNARQPADAVDRLSQDIEDIYLDKVIDATTRQSLINARVGQGKFREEVMKRWDGACAFSSCKTQQALRASHIKPWRECSNRERLDPANGLMLTANLDALFDYGLLSFEDNGRILISSCLSGEDRELLGVRDGCLQRKLSKAEGKYLAHHRENIFIE